MADKNHNSAIQMLHHHGFLTRSDITSEFVGHDIAQDIGRSDIVATRMGVTVNVEVKQGGTSWRHHPKFEKGKWRTGWTFKQRLWAAMSMGNPFCVPYYIFLTMGKDPASWHPDKYIPRKSWLIPFITAYNAISAIEGAGMMSMPYNLKKGSRRVYSDNGWAACELFEPYELQWNKQNSLIRPDWFWETAGRPYGGFWTVPENHEFYRAYIADDKKYDVECANYVEIADRIRSSIPQEPSVSVKKDPLVKAPIKVPVKAVKKKIPGGGSKLNRRKSWYTKG